MTNEETIREAAEELAYAWWPEQTVRDDPELIDVCMRPIRALAEAGLLRQDCTEARADALRKAADDYTNYDSGDNADVVRQWLRIRAAGIARQHAEKVDSDG